MKEYVKYMEILEKCYNKPPNTYLLFLKGIIEKYPTFFRDIKIDNETVACACIVVLNVGFYGISSVAVLPEFQKRGIGSELMKKIHKEFAGVFILRTRNAEKFFEKLGYIEIYRNKNHIIMAYCNESKLINF